MPKLNVSRENKCMLYIKPLLLFYCIVMVSNTVKKKERRGKERYKKRKEDKETIHYHCCNPREDGLVINHVLHP